MLLWKNNVIVSFQTIKFGQGRYEMRGSVDMVKARSDRESVCFSFLGRIRSHVSELVCYEKLFVPYWQCNQTFHGIYCHEKFEGMLTGLQLCKHHLSPLAPLLMAYSLSL